jgi:uncharacterized membrane protein YebE (DUF533 family)
MKGLHMIKIPKDKLLHLGVGAALGLGVGLSTGLPVLGTVISAAAGIGKEAWDHYQNKKAKEAGQPDKHTVDPKDALWTVSGGVVGDVLSFVTRLVL